MSINFLKNPSQYEKKISQCPFINTILLFDNNVYIFWKKNLSLIQMQKSLNKIFTSRRLTEMLYFGLFFYKWIGSVAVVVAFNKVFNLKLKKAQMYQ